MKKIKQRDDTHSFALSEERLLQAVSQSLRQQDIIAVDSRPITESMRKTVKRFSESFLKMAST